MEQSLEGKVAIITGSGSGMGVGIALAVAKAGAAVALVGRTAETLEKTSALIEEAGGRAIVAVCDITDRGQVNAAVAKAQAELGPVWLLVNNAVSTDNRPIEDVDDANLDLVLRSSIHGSLYMMQAVFPTMKAQGGRIINFGSGGATMGLPEVGAYAIAKEGVRGLTKTAATGWGQCRIGDGAALSSVQSDDPDGDVPCWRHGRRDGTIRSRTVSGAHRETSRHPQRARPDIVRAPAAPARCHKGAV
jgi:NAD(P)-dependent dehydrogenase (short-subunit alcohol dehydrogenase family)